MNQHHFFLLGVKWRDKMTISDHAVCHQIKNVLRLKVKESITVLDNSGFQYQAELLTLDPLTIRVSGKQLNPNEPSQKITLYQSLIKKDKFEWVLQKGTETGISQFVPVLASRSEKKAVARPDRIQSILREAAEQSERGKIPIMAELKTFEAVLSVAKEHLNILLDPASDVPLARYFPSVPAYGVINIFIGPEGGFTPEELQAAKAGGWEPVSLGPRILRTETAGILAAGALLIATQQ